MNRHESLDFGSQEDILISTASSLSLNKETDSADTRPSFEQYEAEIKRRSQATDIEQYDDMDIPVADTKEKDYWAEVL